ncbi:hypothetical protein PR202_gb06161 [Eleusine coracana subsp. coracana]|uniref:RWP-RK domain-containing protein n=1 Tax=Eleusine coracana subsp. coracana TaxID=191504 RepID=A0AAV5E8V1_ELECO|nr:hypothetical protein PR202_gb06161 [Eleusine coracana subsp. coracana]
MVMEMEADMDTVLERFDLLLDRDGRGGSSNNNPTNPLALRGADICYPEATELIQRNTTIIFLTSQQVSNDEEEELLEPAMSEVSRILTTVCEAHQLPLAQTWVRCKRCNTTALTSAAAPFHLAAADDGGARGFREACAEHHLRDGRGGLVEEAAAARGPRFCADVAKYSMDAYPLAHHARFGGLAGCLAVCAELMTRRGGEREDCVLEFFLPPECRDGAAQKAAAEAVAATIRERFGGGELKAVHVCGLHDDLGFEVAADDDDCVQRPDDDRAILAAAVASAEDVEVEAPETNNGEHEKEEEDPKPRAGRRKRKKKKVGKRKNEKTVSLEELQRYFSGRMKDAARSLGVCPTTMKRICRQHGISRWPFRQIAKANNSLDKVKRIFEAVQYTPTPPMAAPAASQQGPTPATAHGAPAVLPCRSGAHGVASSQGSCCQEPPPRKSTIMRKPFHASNDGLVTVKASYRGDIVRFRVPSSAGVEAVKGEVAKRLGLDMDAFDVKYLDDDNEWVLLFATLISRSASKLFRHCQQHHRRLPLELHSRWSG